MTGTIRLQVYRVDSVDLYKLSYPFSAYLGHSKNIMCPSLDDFNKTEGLIRWDKVREPCQPVSSDVLPVNLSWTPTNSSCFSLFLHVPSMVELWARWSSAGPQGPLRGGQRQASHPCSEELPSGSLHLPAPGADQQPALQCQQNHPSHSHR